MTMKLAMLTMLATVWTAGFAQAQLDRAALMDWAAYKAKILCSCVFVSKRDPSSALVEDVGFLGQIEAKIDDRNQTVTTHLLGQPVHKALYREGLGCTMVLGVSEDTLRDQYKPPPAAAALPDDQPWPKGRGSAEKPPVEVDSTKLEAALSQAFVEANASFPHRTRAVVIVYKGKLIAERYAPGFTKDTPLIGWSMSKSALCALAGILVKKGWLKLNEPVPVSEWSEPGDPRAKITLNHLLRMTSGLRFQERYQAGTDMAKMLLSPNSGAFAATMPLVREPGSYWSYSSGDTNIISLTLRTVLGEDLAAYLRFPRGALFDKIGMRSAVMEPGPEGVFVASSFMYATPRDWARLALLYLNDGVWNGESILPRGWVDYVRKPTPAAPSGKYGAHFWLNAGEGSDPSTRPWGELPQDLYRMDGFEGQYAVIVPSRNLIIVRLGLTQGQASFPIRELVAATLAALPAP